MASVSCWVHLSSRFIMIPRYLYDSFWSNRNMFLFLYLRVAGGALFGTLAVYAVFPGLVLIIKPYLSAHCVVMDQASSICCLSCISKVMSSASASPGTFSMLCPFSDLISYPMLVDCSLYSKMSIRRMKISGESVICSGLWSKACNRSALETILNTQGTQGKSMRPCKGE